MALSTAVDVSAVARVVGIKTEFKDLRGGGVLYLPQRVAVVGQGSTDADYANEKRQVTSALEVAQVYGFGSPVHLAALQLMPVNGDGVGTIPVTIYPLSDDENAKPAKCDITAAVAPTEAAAYKLVIGGVKTGAFVIDTDDTADTVGAKMAEEVNAMLELPVTAKATPTGVTLTTKWAGQSANGVTVSVIGSTTSGNTFSITDMAGGLVNPDVTPALEQVGDVWETMLLNTLNIDDTDTLDKFQVFGEGRWGALTRKPCVTFTGNTAVTMLDATAVSVTRKTDRSNSQLVAPGSVNLPFVVAARQLARIVKVANNNPARDYGSQKATNLVAGADGVQWDYPTRDAAVKRGSSTAEVKDGVINVSDTITFFQPTGDPTPAYRYVCDIVKLQNIIFNIDLIFNTPEWDGAPMIPDNQPTVNREAKKPKMAKAAVCSVLDSLGLEALISDPETAKKAALAQISSQNPKRMDLKTVVQLSGNTNIISVDLDFGFFFGKQAIVN